MKVKICGITCAHDALLCEDYGVDYLGFNFFKKSKRFIPPDKARDIIMSLKKTKSIGVFVEPNIDYIKEIVGLCGLHGIQIHGNESAGFCNELRKMFPDRIVIQAFRIEDRLPENISDFECDFFLFDSFNPEIPGGTGKTFNWDVLPLVKPFLNKSFIAGGISPENIDRLLSCITPYGIDVATGVERFPGIKDAEKVKILVEKAKGKNL